ncbi:ATP-binding protein [Anaerosolibacter sp.]|uniref:ATP-binding protein n=1 Tax=Anaerosolibacter sp. TaxID=1872527 RepID=UPI0039EE0C76
MERKNKGIQIPNGSYAVEAYYTPQMLEEYKDNPLIEALPPILSYEKAEELLHSYPSYNDKERELDAHYRYHCIQRLFRYFQPWSRHFDLEQRISRTIRQGYLARSPLKPEYAMGLQQIYGMIKDGRTDFENTLLPRTTASGFTVIGISGVGKSKAIEGVLSLYPQIIIHSKYNGEPFSHYQISWLKLDCPYDGSIKGLCSNFFMEFDRLLGDNTYKKFASGRNTSVNAMMPRMAQLARNHSLGVLVIDEIQHLSLAKSGGSEKMLNFFVNLVNTIGVPVILIGTMKALSVLQSEFRQARRGSGQGDMVWDRMKNDVHWELLIEGMWQYQWTKEYVLLTEELKEALYEESQGIVDIAVKLYAMAQLRAIATGKEKITPKIIQQVAKDSLQLVRPMLLALKSGRVDEIRKYEDIRPIDIQDFQEQTLHMINLNQIKQQHISAQKAKKNDFDIIEQVVIKLLELDVEASIAKRSTEAVMKVIGSDVDVAQIVKEAFKIALQNEDKNKQTYIERKNVRKVKPNNVKDKDDLRHIVEQGKKSQQTAYESLKARGYIKNPSEEFNMLG